MIDTLYYLKKGGRITPAAAALGTLLRLKPVLQIQGEKLDAFAKARTVNQAKSIMINAIKSDIEKRFGGISPENQVYLAIAHTQNEEAAKVFKEEVQAQFPDYPIVAVDLPHWTRLACSHMLQKINIAFLKHALVHKIAHTQCVCAIIFYTSAAVIIAME